MERQLASGVELQVVPQTLLEENDGRSSTYLATVFPTVALITVRSESALLLGEPLIAEMESVGASSYAIPRDQRRSGCISPPGCSPRCARAGRTGSTT